MLSSLFQNPIALSLLIAGAGAQLLKVAIFYIKSRHIHLKDLIATGGMPSSHSALTSALSTAIYLNEGAGTAFLTAIVLMLIVIVDGMGVRRTAGQEGAMIHKLIMNSRLRIKEPHYSLGHTPAQIVVGIFIGVLVAVAVKMF